MSTQAAAGGVIPAWTLGDRLRKAREYTGMDQKQFAAHSGISRGTVTNYEKGHTDRISRPMLAAWAMATGVSLTWLEDGVPPRQGPDGGQSHPTWNSGSFGGDLANLIGERYELAQVHRVIRGRAGNIGSVEDFRALYSKAEAASMSPWEQQRAWWLVAAGGGRPREWGLSDASIKAHLENSGADVTAEDVAEDISARVEGDAKCAIRDSNPEPAD